MQHHACTCRIHSVLFFVVLLAAGHVTFAADRPDPDEALLKSQGIEPEVASIREFLESLHPGSDLNQRVKSLLAQLGDDEFLKREKAMSELFRITTLPVELVAESAKGDDPEVKWRAELVLRQAGKQSAQLLRATLSVIEKRQLSGLGQPVLAAAPFYMSPTLQNRALRALKVTATIDDADYVRRALSSPNEASRLLAASVLPELLGKESAADVRKLFDDPSHQVRLAAAVGLANQGVLDAVQQLVKLLESPTLPVRIRSVQALRAMTGLRFKFIPYEPPAKRAKAVVAWQDWFRDMGQTTKLELPISFDKMKLGRILVCYYNTNRVVEYDAQRKVIWETSVPQPWGCQGLPNGHRLIASWASQSVIEYDAEGKEIWKVSGLGGNPSTVQRLENGNTLVTLYNNGSVFEITPDKKKILAFQAGANISYTERLESGTTLVATQTGQTVIERTPNGKAIWSLTGLNHPFSAHRLENGNTLVSETGNRHVTEFDPDQKVVWRKSGLNTPYDAIRLENGNTLIASASGVQEVDRNGKVVSTFGGGGHALRVVEY